jgi:hypothetical protein
MTRTSLLAAFAAMAALAVPAAASADTIAADPAADQVTALDGTVVWVSGAFGAQRLMMRAPDGTVAPVPGAPVARSYGTVDLGRDRTNTLTLTYKRCLSGSACSVLRDDLEGHRASYRGLAPARCTLSTAPALWRTRSAYGLACRTPGGRTDAQRSGLYVKEDGRRARRLARFSDVARFGVTEVASVDLRGTHVAAVYADIYEYAVSQTVTGGDRHSVLVAASEGESDEHARGLALGTTTTMWTLTQATHTGDPDEVVLSRLQGDCRRHERLVTPPPGQGYRASDVAADGDALYLLEPGVGIVTHAFVPEPLPTC